MKTKFGFRIFFLLILFVRFGTSLNAQNNEKIIEARDKLALSKNKDELIQVKSELERQLVLNYKNYVLHYYIALADQTLANTYANSDMKLAASFINDAIDNCMESIELKEKFDEPYILLSSLYGYKISIEPFNAVELAMKSTNYLKQAKKMNPNNPRLYLVSGINNYYTPEVYGGGMELAKENFNKALELFARYKLPDPTYPNWGLADTYGWLGQIAEKSSDLALAENYYKKGLEIDPNHAYIGYLYSSLITNKKKAPTVIPNGGEFLNNDTITVRINHKFKGKIYYSLDGKDPSIYSNEYKNIPLLISKPCTLKTRVFFDNGSSDITESIFKSGYLIPSTKNRTELKNGLLCKYFEGNWVNMPDFKSLKPLKSFVMKDIKINDSEKNDFFGYQISGFINIPENSAYIFYLNSDDGSRLYIGNKLIIDNDGLHDKTEKSYRINLSQGLHPITILYFQREKEKYLSVSYESKDIVKQSLPLKILFH